MSTVLSMKTPEHSGSSITPHSRVFSFEIQQTDHVVKGKDGRSAELISPSGAHISRLYWCGALTEINRNSRSGWIIRVADPTGVLVLKIPSRSPDLMAVLDSLTPPAFVSITSTAEIDTTPGESGFRLVLETIHPSDREARDQWILRTSLLTLERLHRLSVVLSGEAGIEEERKIINRYKTSSRQLRVLAGVVERALGQVKDTSEQDSGSKLEETGASDATELVMKLIRQHSGPRGVSVQELTGFAEKEGVSQVVLLDTLRALISEDELYQPSSGFVKIL